MRVGEPEQLAFVNCVQGSFIYRRKVYEQIGDYDESFRLVEDWDYWLRTIRSFKIYPLHQQLYEYRSHSESLTRKCKKQVNMAVERLLTHHLREGTTFSKKTRALGYLKLNRLSSRDSRRVDATRYLLRALMLAPRGVMRDRLTLLASLPSRETLAGQFLEWFRRPLTRGSSTGSD